MGGPSQHAVSLHVSRLRASLERACSRRIQIPAALTERSANRRISAGFIVEAATGTTDRLYRSRLTTHQSYQRVQ
jgi:hypothetical protein